MTLERTNRTIALPFGKGTLDLDAPTDHLGLAIANLRDIRAAIDTAVREINDELIKRGDKAASYTYRGGGIKIEMDGPGATEYDAENLRRALKELADRDLIDISAVDAAVEEIIEYKAKKRGINALKKLGGEVLETVERYESPSPRRRGVRVEVSR